MFRILCIVITCFSCLGVAGQLQQNVCVDENYIDPYYNQCQAVFDPVCGCDGKTYLSPCLAVHHGGMISNNYQSGVCEPFWFFIPNFVVSGNFLPFRLQFKSTGSVVLLITDSYGKIFYRGNYSRYNTAPVFDEFDMSSLRPGVYFMIAYNGSHKQSEKFVVISY